MYDSHTKYGNHLKTLQTSYEIGTVGIKWDCVYSDTWALWYKWDICQISAGKQRKSELEVANH